MYKWLTRWRCSGPLMVEGVRLWKNCVWLWGRSLKQSYIQSLFWVQALPLLDRGSRTKWGGGNVEDGATMPFMFEWIHMHSFPSLSSLFCLTFLTNELSLAFQKDGFVFSFWHLKIPTSLQACANGDLYSCVYARGAFTGQNKCGG